jgi:hypothetical protein
MVSKPYAYATSSTSDPVTSTFLPSTSCAREEGTLARSLTIRCDRLRPDQGSPVSLSGWRT